MAGDVRDGDAAQGVGADVGNGFLHELAGEGDVRRRVAAHECLDPDEDRSCRGGRWRRHQFAERLRGEEAFLLEVGLDGGEARLAVFADERVVVRAEDEHILRDAQTMAAAVFEDVVATVVVGGEDADRTLQSLELVRFGEFVRPKASVAQGRAKGAEAVDAPFADGRVVDERIGAAAARREEVVGGGASDGLGVVADEDDVALPGGEAGVMDVHDDGRDVRCREKGGGRLGVGDGDDEAVIALGEGLAHARRREFGGGADERDVPVGRVGICRHAAFAEKAEDAGELVAPGDAGHSQGDEDSFHVPRIIPSALSVAQASPRLPLSLRATSESKMCVS